MNRINKKQHPAANGSKWIRPDKRLAIYLRDGLACAWCGHALEDGERVGAGSLGSSLVRRWQRGDQSGYGLQALTTAAVRPARLKPLPTRSCITTSAKMRKASWRRIHHLRQRPLDRAEAKRIIARRKAGQEK